ncbi:hypothetical protein ON010_g6765 [Phytophthora cinnamomi]|nr:hypothetical protein ON010_g6765 [Phytophthora cinnamomi]
MVQLGWVKAENYKFFIKGHTKNACDRSFGQIKQHVQRQDCWTMVHVTDAVEKSSTSNKCIRVADANAFRDYNFVVDDMYKKVKSIQKYQLFSMSDDMPGEVECRALSSDEPVRHDLRRVYDSVHVDRDHAERLLKVYLKALPRPKVHAEKATQLYKSIRQYVPAEFQSDSLYAALTPEQEENAKAIKKRRRERKNEDTGRIIEEKAPPKQSDT